MNQCRSIWLLLILVSTASQTVWADYPLEIITLKSRPLSQVIPVIKPFVGPGGTVTGMHDKLILRTSPERLREIYKVLEQIDRPPRRLLIQVASDNLSRRYQDRISAGASVRLGDAGKIAAGHPVSRQDGFAANVHSARTFNDLNASQRVQTIEGQPAFIATGTTVPIPVSQRQGMISGGLVRHGDAIAYSNASTGFYVLPRVNGDWVTLEISTNREALGGRPHSIEVQQVNTTVSGRLGQWIDIGRVGTRSRTSDSALLQRGETATYSDQRTLLLVEEVR